MEDHCGTCWKDILKSSFFLGHWTSFYFLFWGSPSICDCYMEMLQFLLVNKWLLYYIIKRWITVICMHLTNFSLNNLVHSSLGFCALPYFGEMGVCSLRWFGEQWDYHYSYFWERKFKYEREKKKSIMLTNLMCIHYDNCLRSC